MNRDIYPESPAYRNGIYRTGDLKVSLLSRISPSLYFYCRLISNVFKSSSRAKRLKYDTAEWSKSSLAVLHSLEDAGIKVEISGLENIKSVDGPCVFVANHMSALETFILPCLIAPIKDATFVVKKSLLEYPVFKHIMRSRDPIAVSRTNPREDLIAVLNGGVQRLKKGISLIIFPQSERTLHFDPREFNSIGIKLAKRADVPVIPIALKTDAWGNGRYLKDFGRIDPSNSVHFAFGKPLRIKGSGREEHEKIVDFISRKLIEWQ